MRCAVLKSYHQPSQPVTDAAVRQTPIAEDDGPCERMRVSAYFEPLSDSTPVETATGGCGLDLAIVHSIALAMGGSVRDERTGAQNLAFAGRSGTRCPT